MPIINEIDSGKNSQFKSQTASNNLRPKLGCSF